MSGVVPRRRLVAVAGLLALTGSAVAPAQTFRPAFAEDSRGDARGGLDIVRVALGRTADGDLRGEITMANSWDTADLRAGGPGSTLCLQLWAKRDETADPPDHLVCATAPADGDELEGQVLRDRANGLPKAVEEAVITRPTRRTIYLRFTRSAIGSPQVVRFAGESILRTRRRCRAPLGCRDVGPNPPTVGTARFRSG